MIHIPKTGGLTILKSFLWKNGYDKKDGYFDNNDLNVFLAGKKEYKDKTYNLEHLTYREYLKLGIFTKDKLNTIDKFTIVRNPYERFVSFYYMLKKKGGDYSNYTIEEHLKRVDINDLMVKPQHLFLEDCDDIKIFKHELYNEVEDFLKLYGITEIKMSNISPEKLTTNREEDIISCKDFVNTHFKKDFELFGYKMI